MKALRFHKARDLRLEEVTPPSSPAPDQAIVKIISCGICGTDLHEFVSGPIILPVEPHPFTKAKIPIILGHEFSAVVVEVGSGVSAVRRGDRVAVLPHLMKPGEYFARRNLGQFSAETGLVGLTWHWGGMGELAAIPVQNLVPLPDKVSDDQGAILEPAAVAVNAIDNAQVMAGTTVLITGAGPIGALTALAARAAGASQIFLYEPNPGRRKLVAAFGGISAFGQSREELLDAIRSQTDSGVGVDAAIECAGQHGAFDLCVAAVKPTGRIAQVGLFVEKAAVDLFKLCEKGLKLIGCWGNDITLGPRLTGLIAGGNFPVEKIVTGRVTLENAVTEGFEALARPGNSHLKILIKMSA